MIWKFVTKILRNFSKNYQIKATKQCFKLWESAIMDQSVTFRKRVYTSTLLPDLMFIRKILQPDPLDYRTWIVYTFPVVYLVLVTVKTQAFGESGKDTIGRGSLKVSCQKIVSEFWET